MKLDVPTFESLIAPVTPQDFLTNFWEKTYLHVSRNQHGIFEDLFSLERCGRPAPVHPRGRRRCADDFLGKVTGRYEAVSTSGY